jgi:hypothetical protein
VRFVILDHEPPLRKSLFTRNSAQKARFWHLTATSVAGTTAAAGLPCRRITILFPWRASCVAYALAARARACAIS